MTLNQVHKMSPLLNSIAGSIESIWKTILALRLKLEDVAQMKSKITLAQRAEIEIMKLEYEQLRNNFNNYISEVEYLGGVVLEFKKVRIAFRVRAGMNEEEIVWEPNKKVLV